MNTPYTRSVFPGGSKCSFDNFSASALPLFVVRAANLDIRDVPAVKAAFFVPLSAAAPPTDAADTAVVRTLSDVCTLADFSGSIPTFSVIASSAEDVSVVAVPL